MTYDHIPEKPVSKSLVVVGEPPASAWVDYELRPVPVYAGYWSIEPGVNVARRERPNWFRRLAVRWVFGWRWVDGKKKETDYGL